MHITVKMASPSGEPIEKQIDATPIAVGAALAAGSGVTVLQPIAGGAAQFASADWAFVTISGPSAMVTKLMDHRFTQGSASVNCVADNGQQCRCVFGFKLPSPVHNAGDYRAILVGLAVVYGADVPKKLSIPWQVEGGGKSAQLTGALNQNLTEMLVILGKEELHRRKHRMSGTVRSGYRLADNTLIQMTDGHAAELHTLAVGMAVHCPVHADVIGTAEIVGKDSPRGVACAGCQRTYWSGKVQQDYDFGHFRRVLRELHQQEQEHFGDTFARDEREFTLVSARYLPSLRLRPGFTLVRSPKNTGKTKALEQLALECKARGKSVLVIGHRKLLLVDLARRLGLNLYFIMDDNGASEQVASTGDADSADAATAPIPLYSADTLLEFENRATWPTGWDKPQGTTHFAICLDSVSHRLNPAVDKYDVIIIDESEQVAQHLISKTLQRSRRDAYLKLRHYLKSAESVYLLDADLDMLTLSLVFDAVDTQFGDEKSDIHFIVNEPPAFEQTYELVNSRPLLMAAIEDAVAAGGKTYVACNSIKEAQKIAARLRSAYPERRIEDVTSENSQEPRILQLLADLPGAFERDLDVLVASPSIGTGIDISFNGGKCVVEHVFGLFYTNIVTHFDIDQQLARVRNPGVVKIWVDPVELRYETAPEVIERELRNTVLRTDVAVDYDREGKPVFSPADAPFVVLWAKIVAMRRASMNRLLQLFNELRAEGGWRAEIAGGSDADRERGKAALADGKKRREAERIERILTAPDIDTDTAEELKERARNGSALTPVERASLDRYYFRTFYACAVDADLIKFDDDERTRARIRLLELLYKPEAVLRARDLRQAKGEFEVRPQYATGWRIGKEAVPHNSHVRENISHVPFDREFWSAKAAILREILAAAGVLDPATGEFLLDAEIVASRLVPFVTKFREHKKRIESEFGLVMRADITAKPTQQMGDLLRLLGLNLAKVEERKIGKTKLRVYRIDAERYVQMLEIIVRREQRSSSLRTGSGADGGDSGPDGDTGDNEPVEKLNTNVDALSPDDDRCADLADVDDQRHGDLANKISAFRTRSGP